MSKLIDTDSAISAIKSTDIATINSIIKKSNARTKQKSTVDYVVPPTIATRQGAQNEADRANQAAQAIVGSKEGFTEAITAKAGSAITDPIINTADGSEYKGVDKYNLADIIAVVLQGADRPYSGDFLTKLASVINYRFNIPTENCHQRQIDAGTSRLHAILQNCRGGRSLCPHHPLQPR